jgi:adenylate cyclase
MSTHNSNNTESLSAAEPPSPAAFDIESLSPRQQRVVLVCDVVESVRWMEHDEDNAITRWSQFATRVREELVQAFGGRVVKSTGDGLLMEFAASQLAASQAVRAAIAMQQLAQQGNLDQAPERHMQLRIGIHHASVRADAYDIYGHGVNLAARITSLAQPNETVVSMEIRDLLVNGLDARLIDMGECYMKHLDEPVRVFKVKPLSECDTIQLNNPSYTSSTSNETAKSAPNLSPETMRVMPAIAVIPFEIHALNSASDESQEAIGDLLADSVIAQLSRSEKLRVISRLSTRALRGRSMSIAEMARSLQADYLLAGSFVQQGQQLLVQAELVNAKDQKVVLAERLKGDLADLFEINSALCEAIAHKVYDAILNEESQKATITPLPNLQSYSLYLGGIQLIHHASPHSFSRGQTVLEHLVERHPRSAIAQTWNAAARMLRTTRGMVSDLKKETAIALRHTQQALDVEPNNALALATEGIIMCQLKDDPDTGYARLQHATEHDPSCALGWLYLATVHSVSNRTKAAIDCALKASSLSPLDPQSYFYDALLGSALLFDGRSADAYKVLERSYSKNRYHATTVRTLIVAMVETERIEEAKALMPHLLSIEPSLTEQKYLSRLRSASAVRQRFSSALVQAGLPKN